MEAAKKLRQPENWQDFETLCKKLWGEIWKCPEIKKNGRNGQEQQGVDIYGIPEMETSYYGIQCKGKDSYTHKQFTEQEITEEIEKAKQFNPPLKKLYFATTAVKDAKIEEFVRLKNRVNIEKRLFEVHIFSWEDIVELIDENKQTHNWYVKNQNYKLSKSVLVTFFGGEKETIISPKFRRKIEIYVQKPNLPESLKNNRATAVLEYLHTPTLEWGGISPLTTYNLSYGAFSIMIQNTGNDPIEEFKVLFAIDGVIQGLETTNERGIIFRNFRSDIILIDGTSNGSIQPQRTILVGSDTYVSNKVFLKPFPKEYELSVKWELISKDFKDNGSLKICIKPIFLESYNRIEVEDTTKIGRKENFEDVIVGEED